jgi:hypothetical protein
MGKESKRILQDMSTINIFRGAFTHTFETIHETGNKAVQDVVKDNLDNAVIFVDGFRKDKNYILKDDALCTIRLFPNGKPGGGGLEITLGILTLGAYTLADSIVVAAKGRTILSYAKEALVKWLFGDTDTNSPQQPDPLQSIPQLRGAKNQPGIDKPYPFVMGKHRFTPYYIGKPYTEIGGEDGEDQYFNALFILGYSKLKVTDIKLGEIDLCSNKEDVYDGPLTPDNDLFLDPAHPENNPKLELRQGPDEVSLYLQKVYEEQLSIELMNVQGKDNHVARFSARNPKKVQIEFTFPRGLIQYNDRGEKLNATVSVTVQWRESGTATWKPFGALNVTRQKAKVMRFVLERIFEYDEIIDTERQIELSIVRNTPVDPDNTRISDAVYLSAIRTWCFDYEKSKEQYEAGGIKELIPQVPMIAKDRDRTCRLGIRLKADDRLSGMIDAINCIVQFCGRTWNGTSWTPDSLDADTPTQNPASIALKAMQSQMMGVNRYADNEDGTNDKINLESFGEFYEWCDGQVTVAGKQAGPFACNGVLTSEKRLDALLDAILMTGRGMRILSGGKYGVLIDKPRTNPVMILNNRNVLEASGGKDFEDLPDGYKIKFIDESDGYQENELYVMNDGSNKPGPDSVIESIEMPFVRNCSTITWTNYRGRIR